MIKLPYPLQNVISRNLFRLLFLILLIPGPVSPLHADEPMETVTLQLKWAHQYQFAGYHAAIEKGFYAEEGLNVQLKEIDPHKISVQSVLDGEAEYGISEGSLVLHRKNGAPVVLLRQIFQHSPLVFISLESSGINSPRDMIGKKVMFEPGEVMPLIALLQETIGGIEKIRHVYPPNKYNDYEELINGNVDVMAVYITDEIHIFSQREIPINIINPQDYGIDFYGDNLFTTENEIKNHPRRVEKMIRASIKGWKYALDHPDEIIDLIEKKYAPRYNKEYLIYQAKMTELMILPDLIPVGKINQNRYERMLETLRRLGMVDDPSIPEDFIFQKNTSSASISLTPQEQEWLNKHRRIVLGAPDKIEPYLIENPDGTISGVFIDYIDVLNNRLGTDINFESEQWSEVIKNAKNKKIDGIIGLKPENADRLGLLKSITISTVYPVIYTRNSETVNSLEDLKGKVIAIRQDSFYAEEIIKPYRNNIQIMTVSDNLEALELVFENKADVMIGLSPDNYLIAKYHLTGITPSHILRNHPMDVVFGIRSDWPEFIQILNKGLMSFTEDEKSALLSKWQSMPVEIPDIQLSSLEKTLLKKNSKIQVGIDPYWAPIEYIDEEGNPLGISIDFLKRVGSILHISFEFVSGDSWFELLDKMDKKEIDLFPAMARTEKREENFAFTRPYINFPIMIFAKKGMHFIGDLKELNGKKVAVASFYAIDEYLTMDYPEIELIRKKSELDAILALQKGEAEFSIGNLFTISTQISNLGDLNLEIVGETPYSYDLCFALRKDLAPLLPVFQKAMNSITAQEKNEIRRKWISVAYKHGFDYSMLWKGAIGVFILIILILLWNRHLAFVVNKRTSELESANKTLREIKNQFEAVYNHHYLLTGLIDIEGRLLMANRTALEFAGIEAKDVVGKYFWDTPWWAHSGEEQHKLREVMAMAMEKKAAHFETTHIALDGEVRNFAFRVSPAFDDKGEVIYLVPEGYDITEQKKAEEALKESEQKYRTLFESASDAIFLMEGDLFIDCNARTLEMFGCEREDIIGKSPVRFSPDMQPDSRPSTEKAEQLILQAIKGIPQFFEWKHMKKDGTLFDAEVTLNSFSLSENRFLLAIVRNITERKRAEEERESLKKQLLQTQKMESIGVLAGGIAHDFNNILSSIFGYTELARMGQLRGENTKDYLDEVLNAGIRAKNLVQHILAFSRQSNLEKEPILISPLIKEALKFIRASIPSTIEVKYDLVESDSSVLADPTQIHQIAMNLCTNAAYAMKAKGGVLDVSLREVDITDETTLHYKELNKGRYIKLTVTDTGTGIDKLVIDRIFDPFFTTKERGEGTGLGLSVIHGIVKDMKGSISVYSESGVGTTFIVMLPVYEGAAKETALEQLILLNGEGRILFVDDEEPIIASGKEILSRLGYDVISTTSSDEALKIFEAQPDEFDLVLTDMTMPNMTGLELSKKLKEIRPDIPIILCTGYSIGLTEEAAIKYGICQIIMKPIISNEMAEAVNKALNSIKRQD